MKGFIRFVIIFTIIDIIFSLLNKKNPQLFYPIQKLAKRWWGKVIPKWITIILIILISITIIYFLNISYSDILIDIIVSLTICICDIVFKGSK